MWAWKFVFVHESVGIHIIIKLFMCCCFTKFHYIKMIMGERCYLDNTDLPTSNTYSEDKGSIVGRKVKHFVTIYTLTPSLGALGNVNLSSHYEMYLNQTKN